MNKWSLFSILLVLGTIVSWNDYATNPDIYGILTFLICLFGSIITVTGMILFHWRRD